ncbi:MAG: PTS sugar transporter subunit IIA [Planctomycetia bacterium]|nr:PTS sugar transporter subunit IIA [Planctomycetia bacterium]
MPDEDFDVDRLAAYLHLAPAQVAKLAERGNLPGRKVAGAWRFSPAEIHHWLEERIGLSDAEELVRVENALQRAREAAEPVISIAAMLPVAAIEIPLPARTRNSAITSMVEIAARTGWLWDPAKMAEAVRSREDLYPTALETGVALLHPRRPLAGILDRPLLALGRSDQGIPFASRRGLLTDVFFLICSVDDAGHLRTLARLSRLLAAPGFLDQLRAAATPQEAHALIVAQEGAIPD